jgi:hypothetical protein
VVLEEMTFIETIMWKAAKEDGRRESFFLVTKEYLSKRDSGQLG